jgi:hypothetical protein
MKKHLLLFVCASALASSAVADGKVSGSYDCDKADPYLRIPIPDQPGQFFQISQSKCAWTKPATVAGIEVKDGTETTFADVTAYGEVSLTARHEATFTNGDKAFVRITGSALRGKWWFTGGTGKLQGMKGSGTWTGKLKSTEPGHGVIVDITGSYKLPKKT